MKLAEGLYIYPERGFPDCNVYVIGDERLAVVDPGGLGALSLRLREMEADGLEVARIELILHTHLHLDHYGANRALRDRTGARILLHPLQRLHRRTSVVEVARFFGLRPVEFEDDGDLPEEELSLGGRRLRLLPVPGHSPDSIAIWCEEEGWMICGDLLFQGSTGRVDLPGGSPSQLKASIERVAELPLELLLPGHLGVLRGRSEIQRNFDFVRRYVFPWL